jgi:hypothetical protein
MSTRFEMIDFIKWMRGYVEADRHGLKTRMFELKHMGAGAAGVRIDTWEAPWKQASEIAADIHTRAVQDAGGAPEEAYVTYRVFVYIGESQVHDSTFSIPVENNVDASPDAVNASPREGGGTRRGQDSMLARHIEENHRTGIEREKTHQRREELLFRQMELQIDSLTRRLAHYEQRHLDMIREIEKGASEQQHRKIEVEQAARRIKMFEEMARLVLPLLPHIANKAFGTKLPEAMHPHIVQLKALFASLTKKEMEGVMAAIGPKIGPVIAMLQEYGQEHQERVEKEDALAKSLAIEEPKATDL